MLFAMESNNPVDQAITFVVMATYQAAWAIIYCLCCTIKAIAYAITENIIIIAKLATIIAIAVILATNPALTIGIALTATFAVITRKGSIYVLCCKR